MWMTCSTGRACLGILLVDRSSVQWHELEERTAAAAAAAVVIRLILGRRLVNLLPVAQRTNAFTNGVVDRPWVVGREFESHVRHENAA